MADILEVIQKDLPTVFPMHPRTRGNLGKMGLADRFERMSQLRIIEPLGNLDFLKLTAEAAGVLTDSGGIQEETTILGVWCLTLRENTERPVTMTSGTNRLVGNDPEKVLSAYFQCRARGRESLPVPEKWDGQAAQRIAQILASAVSCG